LRRTKDSSRGRLCFHLKKEIATIRRNIPPYAATTLLPTICITGVAPALYRRHLHFKELIRALVARQSTYIYVCTSPDTRASGCPPTP